MKNFLTGPRIIGALVMAALALSLAVLLRSPPVEVDVGVASQGPMAVSVEELGETRVTELYTVSAPITGELLRVGLKPGAKVVANQTVLARIQPAEPGPLDARLLRQAQANIGALQADLAAAREFEALSRRELTRVEPLARREFVAQAALDRARSAHEQSLQAVEVAAQRLEMARGALIVADGGARGRGASAVTSPVSGYVLSVPQESSRVVVAGTPLVEVGDPARLEIVTEMLSTDAVQVQPGAKVEILAWGGEAPLAGRVRLVEPSGFTKVSALGVEEQRVNVVIDFVGPREAWARLGHGYRVTVRIVVWASDQVLQAPVSALFRSGGRWNVFLVDAGGRARLTSVEIGRMNDETAEIRRGLAPGARLILHPGQRVTNGVRVRASSDSGAATSGT